jgi:hypothetical protein
MLTRNIFHPSQPARWDPAQAEGFFSERTAMQAVLCVLDSLQASGLHEPLEEPAARPTCHQPFCRQN